MHCLTKSYQLVVYLKQGKTTEGGEEGEEKRWEKAGGEEVVVLAEAEVVKGYFNPAVVAMVLIVRVRVRVSAVALQRDQR